MDERYLMHYGILGMKWGVRRYQNEDGTLTDAGKRRISRALKKKSKLEKKHDKYTNKIAKYEKRYERSYRKVWLRNIGTMTVQDVKTKKKINRIDKFLNKFGDVPINEIVNKIE